MTDQNPSELPCDVVSTFKMNLTRELLTNYDVNRFIEGRLKVPSTKFTTSYDNLCKSTESILVTYT